VAGRGRVAGRTSGLAQIAEVKGQITNKRVILEDNSEISPWPEWVANQSSLYCCNAVAKE
jgi:hypothetical protein